MLGNYLSSLLRSRLEFGFLLFYITFVFAYYGLLISNLQSGVIDTQVLLSNNNLFLKIIICQFFMVLISIPLYVCKFFSCLEVQLKQSVLSGTFLYLSRIIMPFFCACIILITFSLFLSLPILFHAQFLYDVNFQEIGLVCTQILAIFIFVLSITLFLNFYMNNPLSAMIISYFIVLLSGLGYLLFSLSKAAIFLHQGINYHPVFLILLGPFYKSITMISHINPSYVFRLSYLSFLFTHLILSVIFIFFSIKKAGSIRN